MKDLEQFTGIYQRSKTLRFELIPVGETLANIERSGILEADEKLADSYKKMKKTIDEFHKDFVEKALTGARLTGVEEFYRLYNAPQDEKKTDRYKKEFGDAKGKMRKEIVEYFKAQKNFEILFKKDFIQKELKKWIDANKPELYYDPKFKNFTTYFSGYHTARKNMYSDEEKASAIAHRLIDENLPKFIDNIHIFEQIKQSGVSENFPRLCKDMEPWLNVTSLDDLFTLDAYSDFLTQPQIEAYNGIIGGINEYTNRYNQQHPEKKLPKMKVLYKQILSEKVSLSWLPESFENAGELFDAVKDFYDKFTEENTEGRLKAILADLPKRDTEHIYIRNDSSVTAISNALFGYYGVINDAIGFDPEDKKKPDYLSIADIQKALDEYIPPLDNASEELEAGYSPDCVAAYFGKNLCADNNDILKAIIETYEKVEDLLCIEHEKDYILSKEDKENLKAFLDSLMELLHFIKPLHLRPDAILQKDEVFYGDFAPLYEELEKFTKLYDKVRNYVTKKPYSTEKIKLNFGCNGNLLSGWVDSKTETSDNGTQYCGYLFRKANQIGEFDYFLGISPNAKLFRAFNAPALNDLSEYERLDYYQPKETTIFGGAYKGEKSYSARKSDLLNFFAEFAELSAKAETAERVLNYCGKEEPTPSGCIKIIKDDTALYEKLLNDAVFQSFNLTLIEELKQTVMGLDRLSGTEIIGSKDYALFTEIIEDIQQLAKQKVFNYFHVSKTEMETALKSEKKPLYLFKISNKDLDFADKFSKGLRNTRGTDNLHTMYFKALMSGEQTVYDLGTAQVFYRKKSITESTVHYANQPIEKKNPRLKLKGETSTFAYDILKDRRYRFDKFQLHFSMIANYQSPAKPTKFNEKVCAYLKNNPDVNILGIDRGERNLLYISLIDRNGHVLKVEKGEYIQYSLNEISGSYTGKSGEPVNFITPYHELLDKREQERKEARVNWNAIENIKELKSGYLSQVVYLITRLMVKYNAIVVMEDLNGGFKNGRKKVEKQVYQNFEKALIEKLNYLVFKDCEPDEIGGLYHALQLTDEFSGFNRLSKQSGFIFYIPAWNTSKIDPVTGFVDYLKPKYKNIDDAKNFFSKFKSIRYNEEKDWFEFAFDYSDFTEKAEGTRTAWTLCTHGELRYAYNRELNNGRGGVEKFNVTEKLKEVFAKQEINYRAGELIDEILAQSSKNFFKDLIKALQVTLSMRYSCEEDKKDFILSPVADANGEFYCSEGRNDGLPQDADANGAYNIARKGLWVLEEIDRAEKYSDWTTKISNKEWLDYVQTRF